MMLAGLLSAGRVAAAAESEPADDRRPQPSFELQGDLRYRHETIRQQLLDRRDRDRLRVRAGLTARVNDTVEAHIGLATSEGGDPRSSNVTLGRSSARKDVYLDLAHVQWRALPSLTLLGGKMKYPWRRASGSALFDGDVNPEGLAATWRDSGFFASAFHHFIAERAGDSESTLRGAQFGWEPAFRGGQGMLAAGYFDFYRVRGRDPFYDGDAFGNSTTASGCQGGATTCLAQDFDLVQVLAEYSHPVAGRPLVVFADLIRNTAADNGLDTAVSAGITYGRASEPRTWEVGYNFQRVEKDAMFGQFIDSDLGAGNTDHRAHLLSAGYAVASNWVINATWQISSTDLDVPAVVDGVPVRGRDYKRLQLDLNFSF